MWKVIRRQTIESREVFMFVENVIGGERQSIKNGGNGIQSGIGGIGWWIEREEGGRVPKWRGIAMGVHSRR